jgi:hypothetical protein
MPNAPPSVGPMSRRNNSLAKAVGVNRRLGFGLDRKDHFVRFINFILRFQT